MSKQVEFVSLGFKLDGRNFSVWSRLMRIIISSREQLHHIEGDKDPPKTTDLEFNKWQASDFTVFTWLIQNMEPKLVLQLAQHQTAKALRRSLATTFGVRANLVQIYDLEIRTNQLKQGNESLEQYWGDLQQLWVEIPAPTHAARRMTNTMPSPENSLNRALSLLQKRHLGLSNKKKHVLEFGSPQPQLLIQKSGLDSEKEENFLPPRWAAKRPPVPGVTEADRRLSHPEAVDR
ncbi:hypothetical protein SASPL_150559 [Salvia splendens]|uniref:Retrotransposon Copia-like N-terminal domain-containing protein n=1 Tax=Salvia splendens TaxID=180675 RepID=A0A8X8W684_SALSN|nr:hypothetical protein SASPL_150559 [Salvia splendens]